MKDTIGAHLEAAAWRNGMYGSVMADAVLFVGNQREKHLTYAARNKGLAAGHAFRAAELAYDLGQNHGVTLTSNAVVRAFKS